MKIEQLYTGCLAEAAYYIESEGEVAIIDPLRETAPYLEMAEKNNAKIKYIFETHFHADFVSGHVDLAKKTGAKIVFGPGATPAYDIISGEDGQIFEIGKIKIKLLHTPGHTLESSTFLLLDENGKEHSIYSGDTLFIGDVGRPDLAVKSNVNQSDLAGMLFDSLRNKIMTLPNEVIVYPGHGAGSACGKNMSKETFDTLGNQKANNYALRADMSKEEFIKEVTDGLVTPPQYFPKNVMMNKEGYKNIDEIIEKGTMGHSVEEFEAIVKEYNALILDTRKPQEFAKGFIPNSMFFGIDGGFAPWVGALIEDINHPIILVTDEGREEEVVTRLSRVGYDNTLGYLKGGIDAWKVAGKDVDTITSIPADKLEEDLTCDIKVLDVRKVSEYQSEHINNPKVTNFPLDTVHRTFNDLDKNQEYYVHCAGGYRSMIFSSILKAKGFNNLIDVAGGFGAIKKTNIDLTAYVCPSTLL